MTNDIGISIASNLIILNKKGGYDVLENYIIEVYYEKKESNKFINGIIDVHIPVKW